MANIDNQYKVIISAHLVFKAKGGIHGPGDTISDYLVRKKINHVFIRHPLSEIRRTEVIRYKDGKFSKEKIGGTKEKGMLLIKGLSEALLTCIYILRLPRAKYVFIGVDPVNAFAGIFLKWFGKIDKFIFYTADYAIKRYDEKYLNWIYHFIDRVCVRFADYIWNVSSRITKLRKKHGLSEEKNIFVPNAPSFKTMPRRKINEIESFSLIIMAMLNKGTNFPLLFEVIQELKTKFPEIKLKILGEGSEEENLKLMVKKRELAKNIEFLGVESHHEAMKIISGCAVGLALYTTAYPWTFFGDSKKVREYVACGLPVIMNNLPSTADEVSKYEAGLIIDLQKEFLLEAIDKLFSDDKFYAKLRKNAINMARKFDINEILKTRLGKFL